MKKLNILLIVALAFSIFINLSLFVWPPIRQKIYNQGSSAALVAIFQKIQSDGSVSININGQEMTLGQLAEFEE